VGLKPGFGGSSGSGGGSGTVGAGAAGDEPTYSGATTISPVVVPAVKTTSYTPTAIEKLVGYDATGGALAPVLPAATGTGRSYTLFKVDASANAVTVTRAAADTINGATTKVLAAQWDSITVRDYASGKWEIQASSLTAAVSNPVTTAQGGLGANNGGATGFPKFTAGAVAIAALAAGDIPVHNHAGSDITSSVVGTQFGGTGSNLVSTGPGQLVQATNASVITTQSFVDASRGGFKEDFNTFCASGQTSTNGLWAQVSTNTGTAGNIATGGVDTTGVWKVGAGTTSAAGGLYDTKRDYIRISNGILTYKMRVQIPTLSTAGNEFVASFGLTSWDQVEFTAIKPTVGIFFEYDRLISVNWLLTTRASGASQTQLSTGVAVTAGAWVTLNIVINAAGTSVTGDVGGAGTQTNTLTFPSTAQQMNSSFGVIGSAGTAARDAWIDLFNFDYAFTASRG